MLLQQNNFIGYELNLELISRFVCWPTILFVENNLFIFTPCLPHHPHPVPRVKTNTCVTAFSLLYLLPLEQPPAICPFSHLNCDLQETSQSASLWLYLSPTDTSMLDGPSNLWTCSIDFAFEHRFVCRNTEPGYAEDIDATEIWLIDIVISVQMCWIPVCMHSSYSSLSSSSSSSSTAATNYICQMIR